jgi:hypothetical protein
VSTVEFSVERRGVDDPQCGLVVLGQNVRYKVTTHTIDIFTLRRKMMAVRTRDFKLRD